MRASRPCFSFPALLSALKPARCLPIGRLLCLTALLALPGQGAVASERAPLAVRSALDQSVAFHGVISYDTAGSGPAPILYPAPGLAGMLAAIATHAIIANGVQDAEKTRMRDQADQILLPHRPLLGGFKYGELMEDAKSLVANAPALRVLAAGAQPAAGEVLVDSLPMFYMTQDRRALVMENTVSIKAPASAKPYQTVIRVTSPAQGADVSDGFWFADNARQLRQTSAVMLARSLDIALEDMRGSAANVGVFKTVRFSEGGSERMERAEILSTSCDQLVLRTLRGNLMAVPRQPAGAAGEADPACAPVQKI